MNSNIQRRINKYHAYKNHPLKKEYEEKKKIVLSINKSGLFRFRSFLNVMVLLYLVLFICVVASYIFALSDFVDHHLSEMLYGVIVPGILNLIIRGIVGAYAGEDDDNNSRIHKRQVEANEKLFEKIKNEYSKKGLEEFTWDDLCSCYCTFDNACSEPYCGVTGKPLTWQQHNDCKRWGACRRCDVFAKAVVDSNPKG